MNEKRVENNELLCNVLVPFTFIIIVEMLKIDTLHESLFIVHVFMLLLFTIMSTYYHLEKGLIDAGMEI